MVLNEKFASTSARRNKFIAFVKVFMQRHFDVLWPLCKVNVKWVNNFFYRSSLFCFFREKFSFK